ncbi:ATP-binding protein [Paenibacillus sp. GD4]|uniref:ATP-binding protein n=1 Tax=Paenibacillus sp. GD4 TaxID=3068890 RepID=UPI002796B0DB|nr:ATP-binding protein [Paenibacillus sp. GD4]MDQ1913075.1 ATP-binding protein [Paenibacillus sp. GD4]
MNLRWIFLLYIAIVCFFSLISHPSSAQAPYLIAFSFIYALSHFSKHEASPVFRYMQYGLLIGFHYISATDWCLPLYLVYMAQSIGRERKITAITTSFLLMILFSAIAFSYRPANLPELSNVIFMVASCLLLALLFRNYLADMEKQAKVLTDEKQRLTTHDALTGLYNYEEFHRQVEKLVEANRTIAITLLDCKDLKSLNTTNGFQGVNNILRQVGQLLRIMFPEALLVARYGGDEFAIVLESGDMQHTLNTTTQLLASEFPKLTGIEINFGIAFYPFDGYTKDDLIFVAEKSLYTMKRESWLKREEHMLRSEKLRVVGELASGMAHEIRNPLTTIKGFLQLSKASQYNIEPWYELIMDEINRMSMLTGEFLQFSKPHTSKYKALSIQVCVERVISLLDSESARLGHRILFDRPNEPVLMMMDQDKILQLLLNLVKNAFEAMPEQGLVHIRLTHNGAQAVLEITDTGKGIPKEELDQIFLPFYTTKDSGTGLGLSICHKIIQDHEGTIEVESIAGEGTKFTISVPVVTAEEPIGV